MITTIPQLNEFLAAKMERLKAEQRDLDHAEGLLMNAQFDQLAAARKLEEETAAVATAPVKKPLARPSDIDIIDVLADHFVIDARQVIEWLTDMDLNAAMLEASI